MIVALAFLGILLVYINKGAPMAAATTDSTDLLDTLDVSRYRTEAAVDMTTDY